MRKHKFFIFVSVLFISFGFAFNVCPITGYADNTPVPTEIRLEYSKDGNTLPSLLENGYRYTVSLYESVGGQKILIEKNIPVYKYKFAKPGEYVLQWDLENIETGEKTVLESALHLVDVSAPEIFLVGSYKEFYSVNDEITILPVNIIDDSGENISEYTYSILHNGTDVSSAINNGKFILSSGNYQIVYKAVDSYQNEGKLILTFLALSDGEMPVIPSDDKDKDNSDDQKGGCGSGIIGGNVFVVLAFACLAFIMLKRERKDEKNK